MKNYYGRVMNELAISRGLNLDNMIRSIDTRSTSTANKVLKNVSDTELHQAFVVNANASGYSFNDDDRPERLIRAFFASISAYLSRIKIAKIDEAIAMILTDISGAFKFGAIVEYHENDDNPDEPGNWSLVYTFNEEDIDNLELSKSVKKISFTGNEFKTIFTKVCYDTVDLQINHDSYIYDACCLVIDTIVQILDREAVMDDVVDIEMPDYFIASVEIEDNIKVFGIVPGGRMKEIIKDDSILEL